MKEYTLSEIKENAYNAIQDFKEKLPSLSFEGLKKSDYAYNVINPNQFGFQIDFEGGSVMFLIKNNNRKCEMENKFYLIADEYTEDEFRSGGTISDYNLGNFTEEELKG